LKKKRRKRKNRESAVSDVVADSVGLGVANTVTGSLGIGGGAGNLLSAARTMGAAGTLAKSSKKVMKELEF